MVLTLVISTQEVHAINLVYFLNLPKPCRKLPWIMYGWRVFSVGHPCYDEEQSHLGRSKDPIRSRYLSNMVSLLIIIILAKELFEVGIKMDLCMPKGPKLKKKLNKKSVACGSNISDNLHLSPHLDPSVSYGRTQISDIKIVYYTTIFVSLPVKTMQFILVMVWVCTFNLDLDMSPVIQTWRGSRPSYGTFQ